MSSYSNLCVGIDLGTTNSLIATCREDNGKISTPVKKVARVIDGKGVKRNDELLPSFVYYPQNANGSDCTPIVGDFAKTMHSSMPFRVAKSIKSQMGSSEVSGLQKGIPDNTPEEISARIIRHLIGDAERHFFEEIKDVVITVPASFNPAQRLATIRAAEIAGIDVRNDDGTYNQDILLSEPEAVMYSILNQIRKGEYDANLSFDEKKTIMVFDIGGGTLDITLHTVTKNSENPDVLDMDLIATNRFTPVAGDTFDGCVAEKMFEQYVSMYREQLPEAAVGIEEKKDMLMPSLQAFAEALKVDINNRYDDAEFRHKILPDDTDFDCGGVMPNGYSYSGYFTKKDYEDCVASLMGFQYSFEDYKTIESKAQTQDIIWPVLDVLRKGAKKLGCDDIHIDAVIMSGGMSRLYLVKNRLEQFFNMHIISVQDPDQAVVQGAVIYHFHQHQDSELMKRLHAKEQIEIEAKSASNTGPEKSKSETATVEKPVPDVFIRAGSTVLADSLFLGLKGGATKQIADEGQELPYSSDIIHGFKVEKGQNIVCVPIQNKGKKPGELVTIASGNIKFKNTPANDMPVSIRFDIDKNQIITIEAWMCRDEAGMHPIEIGMVSFSFDSSSSRNNTKATTRKKIVPPPGSALIPANEVSSLISLCKKRNGDKAGIKRKKTTILSCGNPQDFSKPLLEAIKRDQNNLSICFNLIPLSRKLSKFWTDAEQRELVRICQSILQPEISGYSLRQANWNSVYNECIITIGVLGTPADAEKLYMPRLINASSYNDALIFAFASQGVHYDYVAGFLFKGTPVAYRWIGLAFSRSPDLSEKAAKTDRVISILQKVLDNNKESENTLVDAVISLGLICDRRTSSKKKTPDSICDSIYSKIKSLNASSLTFTNASKPISVALKLISGTELDAVEEQYLLSFYEG